MLQMNSPHLFSNTHVGSTKHLLIRRVKCLGDANTMNQNLPLNYEIILATIRPNRKKIKFDCLKTPNVSSLQEPIHI